MYVPRPATCLDPFERCLSDWHCAPQRCEAYGGRCVVRAGSEVVLLMPPFIGTLDS